ncbi:diguanylate cyclase [Ferrimonas sediminicola]|uniref:diguanylate cyclase n=1 Tax=Ferrimonas sediminicola TaxID=2569538 RepID=A0A4U1BEP3_9GAMM|nr:GGDEF domain-containing protein [Ferrimonas sediminicola]TKB48460.1 diguanylate cyclase [Ferrimonas sediminicola]
MPLQPFTLLLILLLAFSAGASEPANPLGAAEVDDSLLELEQLARAQPSLALTRAEKLLDRFNYLKPPQLCKALQLAALSHLGLGENHNAKRRAKRAATCAEELGLYGELVYDLKLEAIASHQLMEEVDAFGVYLKALKYLDRVEDPQRKSDVLMSVANVYISIGDPDQALFYAERARAILKDQPTGKCGQALLLLSIRQMRGYRAEIEFAQEELKQSCLSIDNAYMKIAALIQLGQSHVDIGNDQRALEALDRAWTLQQEGNIELNQGALFHKKAQVLVNMKRFDEAQQVIEEFFNRFSGSYTAAMVESFESVQADVDMATGRYQSAAEHYRKALMAQKEAAEKSNDITLAVQKIQMDSLQQQAQVKEAQALQKAHEAELERERARSKSYIAVSAAVAFGIVGMALVNRRMGRSRKLYKDLAHYDGLTGLYSRWFWLQSAERRCQLLDPATPASVLLLRIDELRALNLEHGYSVGDAVMQRVAAELTEIKPDSALVGRTGGNQMALLLSEMSRPAATELAERIRNRIEMLPPAEMDLSRGITVTLGVCGYSRQRDLSELVLKADKALDEGRQGGGNQVFAFEGN